MGSMNACMELVGFSTSNKVTSHWFKVSACEVSVIFADTDTSLHSYNYSIVCTYIVYSIKDDIANPFIIIFQFVFLTLRRFFKLLTRLMSNFVSVIGVKQMNSKLVKPNYASISVINAIRVIAHMKISNTISCKKNMFHVYQRTAYVYELKYLIIFF